MSRRKHKEEKAVTSVCHLREAPRTGSVLRALRSEEHWQKVTVIRAAGRRDICVEWRGFTLLNKSLGNCSLRSLTHLSEVG